MKPIDLLEEARKRFRLAEETWSENRSAAVEDARFRFGEQWPEKIRDLREKAGRPCLVVDKLSQYIRQILNDGRQNRPEVRVRPVDDHADKEAAQVFQGIIRHICDRSNADAAYDTAQEWAVTGGFGFFRVLTDYSHNGTFDQEIFVRRIRNQFTVLLDPMTQEADGSDASFGFVYEEIRKEDFKQRYPKAKVVDWQADGIKYADGWLSDETVRVAEYFWKEFQTTLLHLLDDGTTIDDETYQRAVQEGIPVPQIVESREIPTPKVRWARMTGAEVLEQQNWPGIYIPIIPVWGNESDIDGRVSYSGLIRPAKDAQRLYNYSRSAYAERVALTPKAPYIAADGQVDEYFDEWSASNSENIAVLRYKPMDLAGQPVPPPIRQPASDIPAGFAQDMQIAEHDIQAALGMYAASIGQPSNERSGRAILARQREGDVSTFHYHDNLNRAIKYLGRILVDLIPKVYDSQRIIRILGEDGRAESAYIDPTQPLAVQRIGAKTIYNLGIGVYDVTVAAGPSYTTKREEAVESMLRIVQAYPQLFPVVGDLMVRFMDWPGAEEIANRLKTMLPPEIREAEQRGGQLPPEMQAIVTQAEQAIQQREQALQQATAALTDLQKQVEDLKREHEDREKELEVKAYEATIKAYSAETQRLQAVAPAFNEQQIQQIVIQTLQDLMTPNTVPEEIENGMQDQQGQEQGQQEGFEGQAQEGEGFEGATQPLIQQPAPPEMAEPPEVVL